MSYYVYGFRLRGDPECRYVGMTSQEPDIRLAARMGEAERRAKWTGTLPGSFHAWLIENRERVEAFKIAKVETLADARIYERAMVALILRLDHRLFNLWLVPAERRIKCVEPANETCAA